MRIHGRATSVKLERAFWDALEKVARAKSLPLSKLVANVQSDMPQQASLASWLRVFAISQDWLRVGKEHGETLTSLE